MTWMCYTKINCGKEREVKKCEKDRTLEVILGKGASK